MNTWELPVTLTVGGKEYDIRTDYRAILDILKYFNSPDYEDDEKWMICLVILFVDFEDMPVSEYSEACQKAKEFIDAGMEPDDKKRTTLMDWEQDAALIIPAVNRVAGHEVRAEKYIHWWTFLGYYMEIGESAFSQVVSIRQKKAKGRPLEKWEQEYYRENKRLIDLRTKYTREECEERDRLNAMLQGR